MIVDDYTSIREVFGEILKILGLEVTLAENGKKAIDLMSNHTFDLVFMDIQMPELNGFDALRILLEKEVETPIVALTAHVLTEDVKKYIQSGFSGILEKPFGKTKLIDILEKHLL